MRNFTPSEKKVVKELIKWSSNGHSIQLGEVLRRLFPIEYIKRSPKQNEEFYKHTIEICYNVKKVLIEDILEAICLFELLAQRNYILVKQTFSIEIIGEEQYLMRAVSDDTYYVETLLVNYYNNNLWEFLCSYYYVTNGLKDFAKDFKSIEQRRHEAELEIAKKSLNKTEESFWIALVTLLCTIAFDVLQTCSQQESDSAQNNIIMTVIKGNPTLAIDSIKTVPADTFNVNVIHHQSNSILKLQ